MLSVQVLLLPFASETNNLQAFTPRGGPYRLTGIGSKAIPVLPLVASTIFFPFKCPAWSAAVIIANGALQITSNQPGHPDHGLARAAQIMGWVMIALTIIGIIAWVFFFVIIGGVGLLAGA